MTPEQRIATDNTKIALMELRANVRIMMNFDIPLDHVMHKMILQSIEWEQHLTSLEAR